MVWLSDWRHDQHGRRPYLYIYRKVYQIISVMFFMKNNRLYSRHLGLNKAINVNVGLKGWNPYQAIQVSPHGKDYPTVLKTGNLFYLSQSAFVTHHRSGSSTVSLLCVSLCV